MITDPPWCFRAGHRTSERLRASRGSTASDVHRRNRNAAKVRALQSRWYIQLNIKPGLVGWGRSGPVYRRGVWPRLYLSAEDAWRDIQRLPIFANADTLPGLRGRVISASVERSRGTFPTTRVGWALPKEVAGG